MKKKVLIIVGSLRFSGGAPKVATSFTTCLSSKYDCYSFSMAKTNAWQVSLT